MFTHFILSLSILPIEFKTIKIILIKTTENCVFAVNV